MLLLHGTGTFLTAIREITPVRNKILESSLKCAISLYYQHLAEIVWQLNICTIIGLITHEFDLSLYMWQDVLDTTLCDQVVLDL